MKYSIVVPVYQVEKYLEKCIESVVLQTYRDWELILVDNGATDKSGDICDSYATEDIRIKVIHLEKNVGISNARNIGMKHVSGDYIIFMDSDDFYCDDDFLELVNQRLCVSKADVLCYPYIKFFEERGTFQRRKRPYDFEKLCAGNSAKEGWKYLIENDMLDISAWSKVIKREFILEHNLHFEADLIGEDIVWTLQLIKNAKSIDGIKKCCYAYRIRANSTFSVYKSAKGCLDICHIIQKWVADFEKNEVDIILVNDVKGYLAYQFYVVLGMYHSAEPEQKPKVLEEIKKTMFIAKYAVGKKAKACNVLIRIIGLKGTLRCLNFYIEKVLNKF